MSTYPIRFVSGKLLDTLCQMEETNRGKILLNLPYEYVEQMGSQLIQGESCSWYNVLLSIKTGRPNEHSVSLAVTAELAKNDSFKSKHLLDA
jgi:hypothetical protein